MPKSLKLSRHLPQLTCLMMSTRYSFIAFVRKDLPRKISKWICGLSPVISTNFSSNKTHFLHSASNNCGSNLWSVQNLWSVFTKATPWGRNKRYIFYLAFPKMKIECPHTSCRVPVRVPSTLTAEWLIVSPVFVSRVSYTARIIVRKLKKSFS